MKTIYLFVAGVIIQSAAFSQELLEKTDLRFYEHHSSAINGGAAFGDGANGSQSGYDFVTHSYFSSFNPTTFGAYTGGEESDLDMVEHNGPFGDGGQFGFTAGVSTIWGGDITGNSTTMWVEAPVSFDYSSASDVSGISSVYAAGTPSLAIGAVTSGRSYIGKIRGTNYYVALYCSSVENVIGFPDEIDNVYFDFDYKYGTLSLASLEDIEEKNSLNIFPNPANIDQVTLSNLDGEEGFVEIYNVTGEVIGGYSMNKQENLTISVRDWKKGVPCSFCKKHNYFYNAIDCGIIKFKSISRSSKKSRNN